MNYPILLFIQLKESEKNHTVLLRVYFDIIRAILTWMIFFGEIQFLCTQRNEVVALISCLMRFGSLELFDNPFSTSKGPHKSTHVTELVQTTSNPHPINHGR